MNTGNPDSTSDLQAIFSAHFEASIAAKRQTLASSGAALGRASERLIATLAAQGRVFACGNGGSAADCQHFVAELTGRFERERPGLPAVSLTVDTSALTAVGNDYGFDRVFERQLRALARPGDLLLALSTSGNSPNVARAVEAAHDIGVTVVALTGRDGGQIARALTGEDVELRVASEVTARIQETHILLLHCLCDAVDRRLFPAA